MEFVCCPLAASRKKRTVGKNLGQRIQQSKGASLGVAGELALELEFEPIEARFGHRNWVELSWAEPSPKRGLASWARFGSVLSSSLAGWNSSSSVGSQFGLSILSLWSTGLFETESPSWAVLRAPTAVGSHLSPNFFNKIIKKTLLNKWQSIYGSLHQTLKAINLNSPHSQFSLISQILFNFLF